MNIYLLERIYRIWWLQYVLDSWPILVMRLIIMFDLNFLRHGWGVVPSMLRQISSMLRDITCLLHGIYWHTSIRLNLLLHNR